MEYQDIADLEEDERITKIGNKVLSGRKPVAFVTDDDKGKADRYIRKLQERYGLVVLARGNGPTKHAVWVKVGPPAS